MTSSDLKGNQGLTVEGIDPEKFDTLATKNFSSWEDVHTTLCVLPAGEVIVRLQNMLADKTWIIPK